VIIFIKDNISIYTHNEAHIISEPKKNKKKKNCRRERNGRQNSKNVENYINKNAYLRKNKHSCLYKYISCSTSSFHIILISNKNSTFYFVVS